MSTTRIATLDGVWELQPMIVLRPQQPSDRFGFTIELDDVDRLITMADQEPDLEESGFTIKMGATPGLPDEHIEIPPGEPSRNAIAALRWFQDAIDGAGPMPATNE